MKIILFIFKLFIILEKTNSETRFIFEAFRHGARSPWYNLDSENKDIFNEYWINGRAQLTNIGKRQHYLLGLRNRKKYINYLNQTYSPSEIYILSTDTSRTLMSAYSQLQGLFPLGLSQISLNMTDIAVPPVYDIDNSKELESLGLFSLPMGIQVIPVEIQKDKNFFLYQNNMCKGVNEVYTQGLKSEIIKNISKSFMERHSNQLSNINIMSQDLDFAKIVSICDMFISDYTDKREFKILKNSSIDMNKFNQSCFDILYAETFKVKYENRDVGIITMTPFYKMILNYMEKRILADSNGEGYSDINPKMMMYSGHDDTLAGFQSFLKFTFEDYFDLFIYPSFASSIYFELSIKNNIYYVDVSFNDKILFNITYDEFSLRLNRSFVENDIINKFCEFEYKDSNTSYVLILVIFILLVSVLIYYRKRRKHEGFMQL